MLVPLREVPRIERIRKLAERYPSIDPTAVESYLALLVVANDLSREIERFLAQHDMAPGRFVVLMFLLREGQPPTSPSELAKRARVTRATMTGLLDGLERDGLVRRTAHPDDRRMTVVELTEDGQHFLDRLLPDYFDMTGGLMSHLDDDERTTLVRLLDKVQEGVTAAGEAR